LRDPVNDEAALFRLWREKRDEVNPEDLSGNLLVQLGIVTEHLNRHWYEKNTGLVVIEVQRQVFHPVHRWMAATLVRPVMIERGRPGQPVEIGKFGPGVGAAHIDAPGGRARGAGQAIKVGRDQL
jgi:hypothetical protein